MKLSSFIATTKKIVQLDTYKKFSLKKELVSEIDELIKQRNASELNTFIDNGYVLNKEQVLHIMDIGYGFRSNKINDMLKKTYENELKQDLYSGISDIAKACVAINKKAKEGHYQDFRNSFEYIKPILQYIKTYKPDYSKEPDIISLYEKIEMIYTFSKNYHSTYGFNDRDKVCSALDNMKNFSETILEHIKNAVPHIEKSKMEQKLSKYSSVLQDFPDIKENMAKDALNTIKKFDEKHLPRQAQNYINDIRSTYKEIKQEGIGVKEKLDLENIYNKRFPQVIEEYILISPRYREKFKGQNVDPDNLLIEALEEIKTKINDIFESIEQKNHTKLKVTRNYLGNI